MRDSTKAKSMNSTKCNDLSKRMNSSPYLTPGVKTLLNTKANNWPEMKRRIELTAVRHPVVNNTGHKDCTGKIKLVPKSMGWLWNAPDSESQLPKGWKPGTIATGAQKRMKKVRK